MFDRYQAVAGKLNSLGKTAGQALDALTIGLKMNGKTQIYARKLWISLGLFPS
jgi:hypothetical protein